MNTNYDTVTDDSLLKTNKKRQFLPQTDAVIHSSRAFLPWIEGIIVFVLLLAALVPRIILAHQLDLVTDEIIYIMGGKAYFPLLLHLRITSNQWLFNYEHPPVVKLLIGLSIFLNAHLGRLLSELFAARVPSILSGTILIVAIYWLGRAPFGRIVALLAALCLALSPWLVYFSALAYLDMTMTALITVAYLILWPAIHQPRLYLLSALLMGLGIASKYTAVLALPGMIFFTAYYFIAIRPRLDIKQRPLVPWKWWLIALLLIPVIFFIADPAIWQQPYSLLLQSVLFEWRHSITGHLTFLAGQYGEHVPHWAVLYIIFAKLSIFVTLPAVFFLVYSVIQLVRFHLKKANLSIIEVTSIAYLCTWLVSIVSMFSLLNIVVGTHYHLPLAPPIALAGAYGIIALVRFVSKAFRASHVNTESHIQKETAPGSSVTTGRRRIKIRSVVVLAVLFILFVGPHLLGLLTSYAAEGYTSEIFNGENSVLQVAYPGYREAALWLIAHTRSSGRVGIVALPGTLNHGDYHSSWYSYNRDIQGRLTYSEVQPTSASFPFDYLVWPMHLIQRGFAIPEAWRSHVVHVIMGGNTIYCLILAHTPGTIT
jgi:4-amino-4-deoxy-L-arabinose transferase-like glycosyltransferase